MHHPTAPDRNVGRLQVDKVLESFYQESSGLQEKLVRRILASDKSKLIPNLVYRTRSAHDHSSRPSRP